jgi:hypothetical protein
MPMAATATIAIRGTVIPAAGPAAYTIHIPSSTRGRSARLERPPTRKSMVMITERNETRPELADCRAPEPTHKTLVITDRGGVRLSLHTTGLESDR